MLDDALLRRFDNMIEFSLPNENEIKQLVNLTLKNGHFLFDNKTAANKILKESKGLSYYSIQKTLITAIKRSLFAASKEEIKLNSKINTLIWKRLIETEKKSLNK